MAFEKFQNAEMAQRVSDEFENKLRLKARAEMAHTEGNYGILMRYLQARNIAMTADSFYSTAIGPCRQAIEWIKPPVNEPMVQQTRDGARPNHARPADGQNMSSARGEYQSAVEAGVAIVRDQIARSEAAAFLRIENDISTWSSGRNHAKNQRGREALSNFYKSLRAKKLKSDEVKIRMRDFENGLK